MKKIILYSLFIFAYPGLSTAETVEPKPSLLLDVGTDFTWYATGDPNITEETLAVNFLLFAFTNRYGFVFNVLYPINNNSAFGIETGYLAWLFGENTIIIDVFNIPLYALCRFEFGRFRIQPYAGAVIRYFPPDVFTGLSGQQWLFSADLGTKAGFRTNFLYFYIIIGVASEGIDFAPNETFLMKYGFGCDYRLIPFI